MRALITLPVLMQLIGLTALIGYLLFRGGRQATEAVALQLLKETSGRTIQQLDDYLQSAQQVNQGHRTVFEAGILDLQDSNELHRYVILELQQRQGLTSIVFATPEGTARVVHRIEPEQFELGTTRLRAFDLPFEAGLTPLDSPRELALYSTRVSRLSTAESDNALVRGATRHLIAQFKSFSKIQKPHQLSVKIDGERHFLRVTPYGHNNGLNWFIVTVVPEYSFMGDIYSSLSRTVAVCALMLLSAVALCFWIARRIARPIAALNRDAQALERGELVTDLEHQIWRRTAELQQSETRLKAAQRIAKMGSWLLDVATEQVSWSEELLQIYGLTECAPPLNYQSFLSYLPPDDREILQRAVEQAIAKGTSYEVEHRFIRRDSVTLYIISRGEAIFDRQGNVVEIVGTAVDIGDRKRAELKQQDYLQELAEWRDRYETAARASDRVLFEYDLALDVDTWGPNTREILGYSVEEMPQGIADYIALIHPEDRGRFTQILVQDRSETAPYQVEFRFRKPDGTYIWLEEQGVTRFDGAGNAIQVIGYVADISKRKAMELELHTLAMVDSLTQVANRHQLEINLDREWQQHQRTQRPLSLIMLDIDHFKAFNDRYGHPAGDACLRLVAEALQSVVNRPADLVARYGGEEFTLLLPDTDRAGAEAIAQRIQKAIAHMKIANPQASRQYLTVSMGILIAYASADLTAAIAIAKADEMLYRAKRQRNSYCIVQIDQSPPKVHRMSCPT